MPPDGEEGGGSPMRADLEEEEETKRGGRRRSIPRNGLALIFGRRVLSSTAAFIFSLCVCVCANRENAG